MKELGDEFGPWKNLEKGDKIIFKRELKKIMEDSNYCNSIGLNYSKLYTTDLEMIKLKAYQELFSKDSQMSLPF